MRRRINQEQAVKYIYPLLIYSHERTGYCRIFASVGVWVASANDRLRFGTVHSSPAQSYDQQARVKKKTKKQPTGTKFGVHNGEGFSCRQKITHRKHISDVKIPHGGLRCGFNALATSIPCATHTQRIMRYKQSTVNPLVISVRAIRIFSILLPSWLRCALLEKDCYCLERFSF